jgi:hypothetical protein
MIRRHYKTVKVQKDKLHKFIDDMQMTPTYDRERWIRFNVGSPDYYSITIHQQVFRELANKLAEDDIQREYNGN